MDTNQLSQRGDSINFNEINKMIESLKNEMYKMNKKLESLEENLKNEMNKKLESLEENLKNEMNKKLESLEENLEFQNLKINALKEIASLKVSSIKEYRGEFVSEGLGLNSRKKKFVNNPYW